MIHFICTLTLTVNFLQEWCCESVILSDGSEWKLNSKSIKWNFEHTHKTTMRPMVPSKEYFTR